MTGTDERDPAALYTLERRRFAAWLAARPPADLARTVPATPAWTVRDVVAHLVGIPSDLNAGRFGAGGRGGDDWTAQQVAVRRGRSLDELVAEWELEGARFEDGLRLFGTSFSAHYLHDLVQHVADVTAALGEDPRRRDEVVGPALAFVLEALDESLRETGGPGVELATPDLHWVVGPGSPVAAVRAGAWELLRAVGGRRTLEEIRGLDWTGDRDAVISLLSRYPMPTGSLGEPAGD